MKGFDRYAAADRRFLLALTELELEHDRGPGHERDHRAQAAAHLADEIAAGRGDWWDEAKDLLARALGVLIPEIGNEIGDLCQAHGALPRFVFTAILRHLADWSDLDRDGREKAIRDEEVADLARELGIVLSAVEAHGRPVSAPDLVLPPTWTRDRADRLLGIFAKEGWLRATAERTDGWPVYEEGDSWPAQSQHAPLDLPFPGRDPPVSRRPWGR